MERIEEKKKTIATKAKASKSRIERQRNQAKRSMISLGHEEKDTHIEYGSGISRLVMINKGWHKEHHDAANLFWDIITATRHSTILTHAGLTELI
eukprot:12305288-Ditylum_brightwellii.AAC.1